MKFCINGRFLTRPVTGVDRYAREIIKELDGLLDSGEACLLTPEGAKLISEPSYKNIKVIPYGRHRGHAWEQLDLSRYGRKNNLFLINLCNTAPILNPGIVCIHDMNIRANPSFYGWKFRLVYRLLFHFLTRRAKVILTVSEFSRREIEKYYSVAKGKIEVVPNAWQHIEQIQSDSSILNRSGLEPGSYFFAMSSLAPNKNLKWIVETARLNPSETFAVAGGLNPKVFGEHDIPKAENVKYLGYVTDGEAKALMANCKCFLYPTFYEGFGIPPMEAIASGARVVAVSDTEVMHEIYGLSVRYVNPCVPQEEIADICSNDQPQSYALLKTCSWAQASRVVYGCMKTCLKTKLSRWNVE